MARLQLSFATGSTARLTPILDGSLRPEGIDLIPSTVPQGELFWRVPKFDCFDVVEMSLTGYLWGVQHGQAWTALPVFPGWVFGCHTETLVREGIERPEDLRGKRIGVPEYPVTAISWIRHAWQQENGLRPSEVVWYEERADWGSHYRLMGYRPPAGVETVVIPESKTLGQMLIDGELDAVTRYFGRPARYPAPIAPDRSTIPMRELAQQPGVKWLYPDRKAAAIEYTKKLGYLQPIHCIAMKRPIAEMHPWVALNLVNAFAEAAYRTAEAPSVHPASYRLTREELDEAIGADFWPIGVKRNRPAIEGALQLFYEQGFGRSDRPFRVDEFFEPSTLET